FCKQKTAYELTRRDWSSDVCSSDLSRERLEAHRAGAGEEVEDGRAVDGTDQVEGRLAGTVRGRTRVMSLRGEDPRALVCAGDDSHVGTVPEGDCPSNRLRRRARLMGQSPSGDSP